MTFDGTVNGYVTQGYGVIKWVPTHGGIQLG